MGGMAQRQGLAVPGSALLELTAGVAFLRPEDAMVEAMLRGWQAQQLSRGLRQDSIEARGQLVRRFLAFTNDYPWQWTAAHKRGTPYRAPEPHREPQFNRQESATGSNRSAVFGLQPMGQQTLALFASLLTVVLDLAEPVGQFR